jgi:hypothetical protein
MSTLTVYPQAGQGGSNVTTDDWVNRSVGAGSEEDWATIRDSAGTGASANIDDSTYADLYVASDTPTNKYRRLKRAIFTFDTSSLTSGATISAAVLSLRGTGVTNTLGSPDLDIVSATPASNNTVAAADYSQLGTTDLGHIAIGDYSTSAYNNITLNASGIAAISKTGVTPFGTRLSWDTDNSFGGTWATNKSAQFNGRFADYTGTTSDPKLVVTYTVGLSNVKTINGLAIASVKTVNGLAAASVKSVNGLT